jgi:ribosome biogenesis protein MAK21
MAQNEQKSLMEAKF